VRTPYTISATSKQEALMSDEQIQDLRYGVLDLYKKFTLQIGILLQLLPSVLAMVQTLKELDPQFESVYARHFAAVTDSDRIKGLDALRGLLDQAVRTLQIKWGL
jgi:type IV secretory pathway TrbD component